MPHLPFSGWQSEPVRRYEFSTSAVPGLNQTSRLRCLFGCACAFGLRLRIRYDCEVCSVASYLTGWCLNKIWSRCMCWGSYPSLWLANWCVIRNLRKWSSSISAVVVLFLFPLEFIASTERGMLKRIGLPISNSAGDNPHHVSGAERYLERLFTRPTHCHEHRSQPLSAVYRKKPQNYVAIHSCISLLPASPFKSKDRLKTQTLSSLLSSNTVAQAGQERDK